MIAIKKVAASALCACAGVIFYAPSAWALLPIQHWTEPSGAKVWLVESPVIPMVDVQLDFDAGSRRDPAGQAGLAGAVASMASKGVLAMAGEGAAPPLDENALGEAWADLGASFDASAGSDALHFSLRSLTDPALLQRAALLAARQMGEPSWPADIWQRERARWSASIKESRTRPATVAGEAFATAVYGSHPYGFRATEDTLARIEVADMQAFHARTIAACRARVSIVGAVNRAQAQTLVATLLSRLPQRTGAECAPLPAVPEVQALTAPAEQRIPFASAQAHVLIGQPGFARRDPDFLALLVGNHILGEVKKEYADLLRRADAIFIEELRNFVDEATGKTWYDLTSQAFTVFLPVKSVGVMGDGRTYDYVVALRAVQTSDFMTADWAELPYALLKKVSGRIINEVRGINRVTYDVSSKPPATIEWE